MKIKMLTIAGILAHSLSLQAAVIYSHSGNADPTTEGWTLVQVGSGTSVGPVTNDLGTGLDAWFTDDDGTVGSNNASYNGSITVGEIADGNANGWVLSTHLRVVDLDDDVDTSVFALYRDGTTSWQMHFGSEADGDPIVELATTSGGPTFTLQGSGGGYHLFELVYDPIAASADLFVDGSEVISDYTGFAYGVSAGIGWGAGSSAGVGQGNFNSVQFTVVPEPSSSMLLIASAFGVGVLARRRVGPAVQ